MQIEALHTVVGQLEVSVAAAEAEYNRQLARNREELQALRSSRGAELTAMLVSDILLSWVCMYAAWKQGHLTALKVEKVLRSIHPVVAAACKSCLSLLFMRHAI